MTHYQLPGYYSQTDAEKVKAILQGRSFMNFQVGIANIAGNCCISIHTDYYDDDEMTKEEKQAALRDFIIFCLVTCM